MNYSKSIFPLLPCDSPGRRLLPDGSETIPQWAPVSACLSEPSERFRVQQDIDANNGQLFRCSEECVVSRSELGPMSQATPVLPRYRGNSISPRRRRQPFCVEFRRLGWRANGLRGFCLFEGGWTLSPNASWVSQSNKVQHLNGQRGIFWSSQGAFVSL